MDTITKDHQKPAPWTLLYADDVMLASEDKSELESQVQTWSDRLAMFGLRSKTYRTVIRPVAIYGAECWPATKEVEARLSVMETKMLRWTAGVTRLDRISNDAIRERFGVAPIVDKMRDARLQWYGHTLRAKNDSVRKISLNLDVSGKRPRGRPKQRWLDTLHEDPKAVNIHPDQAFNRMS
uniref:Endonuclease-reverse transcriptase n=1 Tax=Haemonchus contortus TaxID=6289 RepID=W6NIV3_HAECO